MLQWGSIGLAACQFETACAMHALCWRRSSLVNHILFCGVWTMIVICRHTWPLLDDTGVGCVPAACCSAQCWHWGRSHACRNVLCCAMALSHLASPRGLHSTTLHVAGLPLGRLHPPPLFAEACYRSDCGTMHAMARAWPLPCIACTLVARHCLATHRLHTRGGGWHEAGARAALLLWLLAC